MTSLQPEHDALVREAMGANAALVDLVGSCAQHPPGVALADCETCAPIAAAMRRYQVATQRLHLLQDRIHLEELRGSLAPKPERRPFWARLTRQAPPARHGDEAYQPGPRRNSA